MNRFSFIGNVVAKPELKVAKKSDGSEFNTAEFRIGVSRRFSKEQSDFFRLKAFGKLAETCAEYLDKGRQVYAEGRIETGSYEKDGVKHYTTDFIVDTVEFLGGGRREAAADAPEMDTSDEPL